MVKPSSALAAIALGLMSFAWTLVASEAFPKRLTPWALQFEAASLAPIGQTVPVLSGGLGLELVLVPPGLRDFSREVFSGSSFLRHLHFTLGVSALHAVGVAYGRTFTALTVLPGIALFLPTDSKETEWMWARLECGFGADNAMRSGAQSSSFVLQPGLKSGYAWLWGRSRLGPYVQMVETIDLSVLSFWGAGVMVGLEF